ncbi:MAG: ketopantoate reductase family protein [Candidatus Thorarchaeota archaeon]
MRVAVVGVGAIGGPIAAHLVENDVDVIAVTKHPKLAATIQTKGLRLQGAEEARAVRIKAVPLIEDLKGHYDIVFLAMKATEVEAAAKALLPFLQDDSVVVTLQNGIVEDAVAAIVGQSRVISAVVVWASSMAELGNVTVTSNGEFIIGLLDETGNHHRLGEVATLLGYCQPVVVTENIYGALFAKLTINACLNGLGALSGQTSGEILASQRSRRLFMGITTEAITVASRIGIKFENMGGFDIQTVALSARESEASLAEKHTILERLGQIIKDVKASSLQSLERGRKTENDFLNGYITAKGKELGVATPINSKITRLVKEIETGKRHFAPENLLELPLP